MKQKKAAKNSAEKKTRAPSKCATEKKFRHLCRSKSIDVKQFKEQHTEEQQTVELTTFRQLASSGRRNVRLY